MVGRERGSARAARGLLRLERERGEREDRRAQESRRGGRMPGGAPKTFAHRGYGPRIFREYSSTRGPETLGIARFRYPRASSSLPVS